MSERPTVRPVTLARLVEAAHTCESGRRTTADIESTLDVSHRRARETILEALRIGLIAEEATDETYYETTRIGEQFLHGIRDEDWIHVSDILETRSPHYRAFLEAIEAIAPASLDAVLNELADREGHSNHTYNQTSVEVVGDWAERLGRIQRNAFTGTYYPVNREEIPANFAYVLLSVFDELEETAGVSLRQRYLSIPEIREYFCERIGCTRATFDEALLMFAQQNVGKIELSGAPIDTGAKEATLGIKEMTLAESDGLVSTSQSTEQVMSGVEQFGKQYYYLAVHDRELTFTLNND